MLNARNRVKRGLAVVGMTFVSAIALAWALWHQPKLGINVKQVPAKATL